MAVEAVATALLRLDPTGSMLTPIHRLLVKFAYESDVTEPLLELIDKNIVYYPGMAGVSAARRLADASLPPPNYMAAIFGPGELKPAHVLEYDLYCGQVWLERRSWAKAFDALERCVAYPTRDNGASQIMTQAHRKWVLTGLLLHGQAPTEPPYTSSSARKLYAVLSKPYVELASLFPTANVAQLRADAESSAQMWADDGNAGLVREVLAHYQKWQIVRLQDVYTKISFADVRRLTTSAETGRPLDSDDEVVRLTAGMIESGMLRGEIVAAQPKLRQPAHLAFLPAEGDVSETDFAAGLAESAARVRALGAVFRATNERLAVNREYVTHLVKEQKRLEKSKQDRDGPGMFDSQIEDEDLMTGLAHNTL